MFEVGDMVQFMQSNEPERIGAICRVTTANQENSMVVILQCPLNSALEGTKAATQNWKLKKIEGLNNKAFKNLLKSK